MDDNRQAADLSAEQFLYTLPEERIARFPVTPRDHSRLLVWSDERIRHHRFDELPTLLQPGDRVVFNDTRVIPARLQVYRSSGARIELLLLEPCDPSPLVAMAMEAKGSCSWKCMIGNLKRWKTDEVLTLTTAEGVELNASLTDRSLGLVTFHWTPADKAFCEVLGAIGRIPLPPYLKREDEPEDRQRYQTVYARNDGAVAAPTAGLHFTPRVLEALDQRGVERVEVTLHVSAGTFQPVQTADISQHQIHAEQIRISAETIQKLATPGPRTIAVGTTAMRTLESLYWMGVRLLEDPQAAFEVDQTDPWRSYSFSLPSPTEALQHVCAALEARNEKLLSGETRIYLYPGYTFRMVQGLITNFHQPGSTLIPLVAAFTGTAWKEIYAEALQHNYRFLSYGDSSLLLP